MLVDVGRVGLPTWEEQMRRLLDQKGLEEKGIKYSDTHLRRLIRAGKFPKPMQWCNNGLNFWDEDEIDQLIAEKLAQRDEVA
jgi:prophage regulatory protein